MILKYIYFQPALLEHSNELVAAFNFHSRSIANYLEREILKPLKFKTEGFSRIVIEGKAFPKYTFDINSDHVLSIDVAFDVNIYQALNKSQLNEYYISMLTDGFTKINEQIPIPLNELLDGIEAFRASGYENKWVVKKRQFKELGIQCQLNADLTLDAFHLNLLVSKKEKIIFNKEIFTTKPMEGLFEYLLNDIRLDHNKIIVIGKRDKIVYELDINELKEKK